MRTIYAVVVFLLFPLLLSAQESFEFRNKMKEASKLNIDYSLASSHYMGQIMANKMHLIKETYTYVEKGTPMSPGDKVIVRKPVIYYAIRKINKFYKKAIKKGTIDEATAIDQLSYTLDVSYSIFDQDTAEFEEALKSKKKPEEIAEFFQSVKLI